MVDKSIPHIFTVLTSSRKANEFCTFNKEQIVVAKEILFSRSSDSTVLKFAKFLLEEYPFEKLYLKNENNRKLFAFAMAQCWLFTRTNLQESRKFSFLNCFASPLSAIINTEYQLAIDEVEIIERITHKKVDDLISPHCSKTSVDYASRFSTWSFLYELIDSPICELKTLILASNAMSTQTHLLDFSRIVNDECVPSGVEYLGKHGLMMLDAPKANILAIFSLNKLKEFAAESGLENVPSRKDDVINLIKEKCDPEATMTFVEDLLNNTEYGYEYANVRFMLPTIPNAKIFQEYIRGELNRLALYLEFIGCIEYEHHPVLSIIPKQNKPGRRPGDGYLKPTQYDYNKQAFSAKDWISVVSPVYLKIIKNYWDGNCQNILLKVAGQNPNSFPLGQVVSEVMTYWNKIGLLEQYKNETKSSIYETQWLWLLRNYAGYLLSSEEKFQLMPIKRTCNGCGKIFTEWSIPIDIALKVGKNIEFCYLCYSHIFNHRFMANTTKAAQMPNKKMLDYLYKLSKALGFIPTRKYMESIELPAQPVEKQIEIGRLLLRMPAYDIYIEKFTNWLTCLTVASVLDDGHRKTSRGIQCLANDGHLCLSLGEKAIDDWLSDHQITHDKESLYPFDEFLNPNILSRTDWKIGNILIEYAGLMNDDVYAQKMKKKKQLAKKSGLFLLIIEPVDLFSLDEKMGALLM